MYYWLSAGEIEKLTTCEYCSTVSERGYPSSRMFLMINYDKKRSREIEFIQPSELKNWNSSNFSSSRVRAANTFIDFIIQRSTAEKPSNQFPQVKATINFFLTFSFRTIIDIPMKVKFFQKKRKVDRKENLLNNFRFASKVDAPPFLLSGKIKRKKMEIKCSIDKRKGWE